MQLISIIVPIYNTEEILLKQCLDSIRYQTYPNWEAILVDDGSSKITAEFIDTYSKQDKRFKVIHKQNEGTLLARKTGLENSKGEFIANIDHDDRFSCIFLEKMYNLIKASDADFVWCDYVLTTGELHPVCRISDYDWNTEKEINVLQILRNTAFGRPTWNKLVSREIYEMIDFPESHVCLGEDPIQTVQIAFHSSRAYFCSERLYQHRLGGISSKSVSKTNYIECMIKILNKLFNNNIPKLLKDNCKFL